MQTWTGRTLIEVEGGGLLYNGSKSRVQVDGAAFTEVFSLRQSGGQGVVAVRELGAGRSGVGGGGNQRQGSICDTFHPN